MTSTGCPATGDCSGPGASSTVASAVAALPPIPVLLGLTNTEHTPRAPVPPRRRQAEKAPSRALVPTTAGPATETLSSRAAWRCVEDSLAIPLVYRKAEDVAVTLALLRQVHIFTRLSDDELLTLAADMSVFSTRGKAVVITEKAVVTPEMGATDDVAVSLSSDDERHNANRPWLPSTDADALPQPDQLPTTMDDVATENGTMAQREARRSCATQASRHSATSTAATSSEEYPETPLYAVAQGRALLEIPTVNGKRHYPVQEGDVIGLDLHWRCLPPGSRYLTTEPCTLIRWNPTHGSRLARVLRRCQQGVLEQQISFLTSQLKVPLFTPPDDKDTSRRDEATAVAKCLLPLRLSAQQVVIEEGEAADALFFVQSGAVTVTRTVLQRCTRTGAATAQSNRGHQERPRVMETATLHCGEIFGELALLAYNPDTRPGEGVTWDEAYWRHALTHRFLDDIGNDTAAAPASEAYHDDDGADFLRSLRRARRSTAASSGFPGGVEGRSVGFGPSHGGGASGVGANEDDDDDDNAVLEELRYPAKILPRQATVYARSASVVYAMSFADCRRTIHGKALTCLAEFAKGYPAHGDLLEEFEKKERWEVYKQSVVEDVVQRNPHHRTKPPLPPFKH